MLHEVYIIHNDNTFDNLLTECTIATAATSTTTTVYYYC